MIEAGYHPNLSMDDYLADPAPEPSLSTSTVCALVERSPAHAHLNHPRLGGKPGDSTSRGDIGSAVHAMVLGGATVVFAPPAYKDWRTNDAKAFREEAREKGELCLLEKDRHAVEDAAGAARETIGMLGKGRSEVSMLWQAEGVWMRGRADWIGDTGNTDVDLKTCDNADPTTFVRRNIYQNGYDIQAALRGLGHFVLTGKPHEMLWLAVEIEPPYGASLVGMSDGMRALAMRKIVHAAKIWRECLDGGKWPGYPKKIMWAESQTFAEFDVEGRGIPE